MQYLGVDLRIVEGHHTVLLNQLLISLSKILSLSIEQSNCEVIWPLASSEHPQYPDDDC